MIKFIIIKSLYLILFVGLFLKSSYGQNMQDLTNALMYADAFNELDEPNGKNKIDKSCKADPETRRTIISAILFSGVFVSWRLYKISLIKD